ncbi:MAG: FAD-dependent monooxygenase [Candidatus Hydrogenedentes bacterium]|nr:FAD-dependent monooxygenase [Candidatus Hydrogenedentota bacterium]
MNPLAPTLDPDAARCILWDAIVVGAGCAGALAAQQLAKRGRSVLLVDKAAFPRWKVCGCCINARAQGALRLAGLGALLSAHEAVPLDTLRVAARGRTAALPLPGYSALSREVLDAAIVNAAVQAGAHFLPHAQASLAEVVDEHRIVLLRCAGEEFRVTARLVLAADGLGGRLLRGTDPFDSPSTGDSRIGAGAMAESVPDAYAPGTIYMACGTGGYVGLTRVEDGRLDIAAAFDTAFVKDSGSLARAAERVLLDAGFPPLPSIEDLPWRGTPALTRTASQRYAHRALVLGDAAGYVEPFTGEGMAWALTSALAVAPLADQAIGRFDASTGQAWEQLYRRTVTSRQFICRAMAAALRRPALVQGLVALVSFAPGLAAPAIRHVNQLPAPPQGVQP